MNDSLQLRLAYRVRKRLWEKPMPLSEDDQASLADMILLVDLLDGRGLTPPREEGKKEPAFRFRA